MRRISEVQYAKNDGVSIAYQVFGEGAIDLAYIPGLVSHLEYQWEIPAYATAMNRLGSFARVIAIDRRGTGLSDRMAPDALPPLEVLMDDLRVVLDDVGATEVALFGTVQGGHLAILFAGSYPQRAKSLLLYATEPAGLRDDDMPWMWGPDEWDEYFQAIQGWGTQELLEILVAQFFPEGDVSDADAMQTLSWMRTAVSPAGALALSRIYMETDVRGILGSVQAPTLVLHRTGDLIESVAGSRYVASKIPRARFVELPGANHLWYAGDRDSVIDEIQTFLTGSRPPPPALERVLVTVLFTDIVRSTELAVRLGDRRWAEVLAEHDRRARAEIERFRGHYIGSAGDGMLSTFDGPARAVRCAQAIQAATVDLGLRIRAGAHTGEVELDGQDVRGVSVHAGARVAASAEADQVLVTKTVKDLVAGSGLRFEDRGIHKLRGVPDEWQLYAALPG